MNDFISEIYAWDTDWQTFRWRETAIVLLKLLIQQPNVLLLDEPTNDLDIATLTILEDYFRSFPGAVITVSHDRYFLDKVADKLLVFQGNGKQELYYGNMSSYLLKQKNSSSLLKSEAKNTEQGTCWKEKIILYGAKRMGND